MIVHLAGSYFSCDTVNIHKEAEMLLILILKVLCFPMFDRERELLDETMRCLCQSLLLL